MFQGFVFVFFFMDRLGPIKAEATSVRSAQHEALELEPGAPAAITSRAFQHTPPDYSPIRSRFARPVISPQLLRQLASLLCRSSSLRSHLLGKKDEKENVIGGAREAPRATQAAPNRKEPKWLTIAEVQFVAFLRKKAHTHT